MIILLLFLYPCSKWWLCNNPPSPPNSLHTFLVTFILATCSGHCSFLDITIIRALGDLSTQQSSLLYKALICSHNHSWVQNISLSTSFQAPVIYVLRLKYEDMYVYSNLVCFIQQCLTTGWTTGIPCPEEAKGFSSSLISRPVLRLTQRNRGPFSGVEAPLKSDADHSPPSSAKVKNE
jgi:hypothetical protein